MVKSIRVAAQPLVISMGSKKGRKAWTSLMTIDPTETPEALAHEFYLMGLTNWIRSAGTREVAVKDDTGAKIGVRQFTEAEALAAMKARWDKIKGGDMDRHMNYVDPITRRASDNYIAALQAQASKEGKTLPEEKVVRASVLANLKTDAGKPWLEAAKTQLEAETAQAASLSGSIGNLLASLETADEEEDEAEAVPA